MANKNTLTYYFVLASLFVIPIFYFKAYLGPLPLSAEIVLIPLVTLAAIYDYFKGNIRLNEFKLWPFIIVFSLFLIVSLVSLINVIDLTAAIMEIARYLSYVVLFLIVVKINFSKEQYTNFAKWFAASVIIVGLFGVLQYVFNFSLNKAGLYALKEAKGRVDSTFVNPNYYSAFLNYIIPMFLLMAVAYFKDKKAQLLMFAFYAIFVINVILTYTRAAWVTMVCAGILLVILMPKQFTKNLFKIHILISILVLVTIVYFMPDVQSRTGSAVFAIQKLLPKDSKIAEFVGDNVENPDELDPDEMEENSTTNRAVVSRVTLWKTGWVMLRDNPVLGVGMGNYYARYKEYVTKYPELDIGHDAYSVHNSYLKVGAETGFLGLVSFLLIYILYFLTIIKLYFKQNLIGRVMAVGLFVGSVCYMVQNLSNNIIFIPQLNVVFWLTAGLVMGFLTVNQNSRNKFI
ncbi:O-antigen ligase family protein [Bacillus sp. CGMCC 1.16607]|uniref:O-antigen ligase family protein n=1 Tax=Bacillus sp. CGMCC 1.16607 TaxID=3351842 RepID=UPI0036318E6D